MRGKYIITELIIAKHQVLTGFFARLGKVFLICCPSQCWRFKYCKLSVSMFLPFYRSSTEMQIITSSSFLSSSSLVPAGRPLHRLQLLHNLLISASLSLHSFLQLTEIWDGITPHPMSLLHSDYLPPPFSSSPTATWFAGHLTEMW